MAKKRMMQGPPAPTMKGRMTSPVMKPQLGAVMRTENDIPFNGGDFIPASSVMSNRNARLLQINTTLGAGGPRDPVVLPPTLHQHPAGYGAPGARPSPAPRPQRHKPVSQHAAAGYGGAGHAPAKAAPKPAAKKPAGGAGKQVK